MKIEDKKEDAQRESRRALVNAQRILTNFSKGRAVDYSEYTRVDIDLANGYTALGLAYAQLALTYTRELK